jgi:hypothetical protein
MGFGKKLITPSEKAGVKEEVRYVEPNWFKSVNDPEYFKGMKSAERVATYKNIFGLGEEKFSIKMKPHLLKNYIAWCKRENKDCPLLKNKIEHHTKDELIDIVHKAKCGKLKGLKTSEMTKEDIVAHLIKSKCPEIMKLI